jgi:hypothetical protein
MAKMTLDDLVAQLRGVFGDGLRSVVLYGSAAAGEHVADRSDYNVLVIVDALDLDHLRRLSPASRAWADAGNPPPLTFTVQEWRESADIFPMEYADILDRHRLLHGASPFDGIAVARADLRLQLEHEAMGKLLALRQAVLATGDDAARQVELVARGFSTVMVLFRAVERLQGRAPSADSASLCRSVASAAGFDAEPFLTVVRHLRGEDRLAPGRAGPLVAGYLGGLERLVQYVDGLDAHG